MNCPSDCFYIRTPQYECKYKKELTINSPDNIKINIIKLIIKNISSEIIDVKISNFELVDNLGFSTNAISFCDSYFLDKRILTSASSIPPNTQKYIILIFPEIEEECHIDKLLSYNSQTNRYQEININDKTLDNNTSLFINTIELLKKEIDSLKQENDNLKNKETDTTSTEKQINDLIKYTTSEDDDYLYILSDEKDYTISFNREFDKSVDNYNWVDKGTPLITMRLDNVYSYMNCPTKIESPTTGIFEFLKNKLIPYGEVICRIKKYDPLQKQSILFHFEKLRIKETVYKRERKKTIERETLDELINEGLVFNSYVDKFGNRSKIPNDLANAVWNRDGGKCSICNSNLNLEFDHIIPVSKGGATTYRNLQLLCEKCNREKSDKIG